MRRILIGFAGATLLAACGGGNSTGGTTPPPTNKSADGLWNAGYTVNSGPNTGDSMGGTVIASASIGGYFVFLLDKTNGCLESAYSPNDPVINGSSIQVTGTIVSAAPCTFPDGSTSGNFTYTGTVETQSTLSVTSGALSTTGGTSYPLQQDMNFSFDGLYLESSSLSTVAGSYMLNGNPVTIDQSGNIAYPIDANGCSAVGMLSISDSNHALMGVNNTVFSGGCGILTGSGWSGMAFLDDTASPAVLYIALYTPSNQAGVKAITFIGLTKTG